MGAPVRTGNGRSQENAATERRRRVAVGCWFTAGGKAMPQFLKYEDECGERHLVKDLQVLKSEQRFYGGILSHCYDCCAVVDGIMKEFALSYHPKENAWDMVVKG